MAIETIQLRLYQFMKMPIRQRRMMFGQMLLCLALAISCIQLCWGNFVDEADNIAAGWFIANGSILYRDIFSHHFPFPYYWVALVFVLLGPSIIYVRFSLLLFHVLTIWLAMRMSKFYLSLGLMSLIWSLIGAFYFGNLLIFHNFKSVCLLAIFVTAFALHQNAITLRSGDYLVLGCFAITALLSDPMSVYAVGLASLMLFVKNVSWRDVCCLALPVIVTTLIVVIYWYLSGVWSYFWEDAVVFNKEYYSKYITVNLFPLQEMIKVAEKTLHLFDFRWRNMDLFYTLDPNFPPIDHWLFTGFLYRFAIVIGTLLLLFRGNVLTAMFLYFYTATQMVTRGEELFHGIPFYLTALFIACWIVTDENIRNSNHSNEGDLGLSAKFVGELKFLFVHMQSLARTIIALLLVWLMIRGGQTIISHRTQLSYSANFDFFIQSAVDFRKLGCGSGDATFLYYPAEPLIYFFGNIQPSSKYYFLWPWVADRGINDVILALSEPNVQAVVHISTEGDVWGVPNQKTLAPLVKYLESNFVKLDSKNFASPALTNKCATIN